MSANNINDPAVIQALLDRLKSSEAWQRIANPDPATVTSEVSAGFQTYDPSDTFYEGTNNLDERPDEDMPLTEETHTAMTSGPMTTFETSSEPLPAPLGPSVASLLSQLQGSSGPSAATGGGRAPPAQVEPPSTSAPGPSGPHATASAPPPAAPGRPPRPHSGGIGPSSGPSVDAAGPVRQAGPTRPPLDVRTCTFQQALPHLARLAEDPEFLKALTAMKTEQTELERQLWKERRDIQRTHEEKVKAARTNASIVGAAGLTQYEADALTDAFRAELRKFDRQRALPAWDGLVTKQQTALEGWGAPTMFPTALQPDRERQQKIMEVLSGVIVGNERGAARV